MAQKSGLYTGTGDSGTTSLVGGERVKKNCCRLCAYGTVDELSSALGFIAAHPSCSGEPKETILTIQNELFNIGAYLATEYPSSQKEDCRSLTNSRINELETDIDKLDEETPKIRAFILPGGCEAASRAHMARVVCRRAERCILDLADETYIDPKIIKYINRISDYLFILARYFNYKEGYEEIVWKQ